MDKVVREDLDFFQAEKRKVVPDRAELYKKTSYVIAFFPRNYGHAKKAGEIDKEHGEMVDLAAQLDFGDYTVDVNVKAYNAARQMVSRLAERKQWLERLTDQEFSHPFRQDYEQFCKYLNGTELFPYELGDHVRVMLESAKRLKERLSELHAAAVHQGRSGLARRIEVALPMAEGEPSISTNTKHDPRAVSR